MNNYNLLEFDKIKQIITNYCYSKKAKEEILQLKPFKEIGQINYNFSLIDEILNLKIIFNFKEFSDIIPILNSVKNDKIFSFEDLKKIYNNTEITNDLLTLKKNLSDFGKLKSIIEKLYDLSDLNIKYNSIFDEKNKIKDTASKKLLSIRNSIKKIRKQIISILNKELEHYNVNGYLSDNIITMRNDRYVIPIKRNSVNFVEGMVIDSSSTGLTAFVEPSKIIHLNNSLKLLIDEEKFEIFNILSDFTKEILIFSNQLKSNQRIITKLDYFQAISRFAKDYNAKIPIVTDKLVIDLKKAKHPLLIKFYKDENKVIPFDLVMNKNKRIMILSGPNTGGKTVTLKTVGILTLMALSGIPITAEQHSKIGMFSKIFADIGDSQSIDQSLSTFSSHLKNVKEMLIKGDDKSLILIDEIGSSTDPEQGVALAYAILEKIISIGATAIITTHYTALKLFAEEHKNCFNASMVFDLNNHIPTYHLQEGIPGNSFALEIAENLGFPQDVISNAKKISGKENLDLNRLIKKLSEERKILSNEIEKYKKLNKIYQNKIKDYEERLKNFKNTIKKEKEKLISQTKEYLYNIQKEIVNKLEELKKENKNKKKELESFFNEIAHKTKIIEKLENKKGEVKKIQKPYVGMKVWLKDIESEGEIIQIDNNKITVDIDGIYYTTNENNLVNYQTTENSTKKQKFLLEKKPVKMEINLLGNTFDEALPKLITFLDDAYLAGLKKVRIIHGKGTGALRSKIRTYLKSDKRIKNFASANLQNGGNGVTVVEFIDD